jgi:hypothetical protein
MKNEMSVVEATGAVGFRHTEGKVLASGGGGEVAPGPEVVEGRVLLDELEGVLRRYAVLPKWAAETLALWVLHTYAFQLREVSTYIGIGSPGETVRENDVVVGAERVGASTGSGGEH